MGLADNAARAASAARSSGGSPADAAKAAKAYGTSTYQNAFKTVKPKPTTTTKTTKPATTPAARPTTTTPAAGSTPPTLQEQLGIQETLDIQGAQNVYDASAALRLFQRQQANRQLTDALGEIDRAAIANYKGIANDYAARGMSRSGGFMGAESEAMADKTRADQQANQAVTDFLAQLDLQGTSDLNTLNTTKSQIMAAYLARRFAGAQGG